MSGFVRLGVCVAIAYGSGTTDPWEGLRMRTMAILAVVGVLALAGCAAAITPAGPTSSQPAASTGGALVPPAGPTPVVPIQPGSPTDAEQQLLSRVRLDLQNACAPLRSDLAEGAAAGIECTPSSDVVERVALHLFDTKQQLLASYQARLAAHGVPMRTNRGRCLPGQGSEGGYVPGDDHGVEVAERGGCYVDETGRSRYVATLPPYVLMEVEGKVADAAAVERWAWLGNQDQPGGPTVWRENGPASPEK